MNNTNKHTPGPWLFTRIGGNQPRLETQKGERIFWLDPSMALGDLQLIMAAPELLAALEIAAKKTDFTPRVHNIIKRAISKARGAK